MCSIALRAEENQYVKNGFAVLHRNGFQKGISTALLRIPHLASKSDYVEFQECGGESFQEENECSKVANFVPSLNEPEADAERVLVKNKNSDNKGTSLLDGIVASYENNDCTTDKRQLSANKNFLFSKGCDLSSTSRFSSSASVCSGFVQCQWSKCGCEVASDMLLEHIRIKHVATQLRYSTSNETDADEQSFVCLWNGCKVYNRPSCLLTWLERHILSHLGGKPYRCIVAGCGARFASQVMLERHVNGHFSGTCSTSLAVSSRSLRKGDNVIKLPRKRKSRCVRPYPAASHDFFDSRIMETIRKRLTVFSTHHQTDYEISGNSVTFQHAVVARRVDSNGQSEVLIQWNPPNVLEEEWLRECDLSSVGYRTLPLSCLPDVFSSQLLSAV